MKVRPFFSLVLLLLSFGIALDALAYDSRLPASEVLKNFKSVKPLPAKWSITKHAHFDDEVFYSGGVQGKTEILCSVSVSSYLTNKEINKVFQDPQGRQATKAKWIADKIPGSIFPPAFFNAKLVLKPDLSLPIQSANSHLTEYRECLKWETDYSTGDQYAFCTERGKVLSHYLTTYIVMKVHGVEITAGCSQNSQDLSKKDLTWGDVSGALSEILEFQ